MSPCSPDSEDPRAVTDRLFVYGTLQRGGQYHALLQRGQARFLGTASLVTPFPLLLARYPCLLDAPGQGHRVEGELYALPTRHGWQLIDELEQHPHEYRRRIESIECKGQSLQAWTYFYIRPDLSPGSLPAVKRYWPTGSDAGKLLKMANPLWLPIRLAIV